MAKAKESQTSHFYIPRDQFCDCREFIFRNYQLVCKKCGKPMKSAKKPMTSKGRRYKNGFKNKQYE